ncbi:unnamed protein product [Closterium sp. Naga37s-1]|nr:unnamed protein product [Closterium sp. Naga37s-1]
MDSCRGARPSSTATSSDLSAPLLPPAPPQPCPPVAAASTEAHVFESSPPATFAPLSRDSRPRRDQVWLIAFLTALAVLCALCLISALLPSPGPSMSLVALSYARISVSVVAAAPLVWGVLLYVRRRNSLTVLLPALLALVALLFFVGAFLILRLPQLLSSDSLVRTSAGPIAVAAASSHAVAGIGTLAASAVAAARAMVMDGVSSVVRRHGCRSLSLPHCQHQQRMATHSQPPRISTPLLFPRPALLLIPLSQQLRTAHLPTGHLFRYSPSMSRLPVPPLVRPRVTFPVLAPLLLILVRVAAPPGLGLEPLHILVTAPFAAVVRKVIVLCAVVAGEGETPGVCAAWLLPLLTQLVNPPLLLLFLLLGMWAVVVFSMLLALLVAALVGHGLSTQEGDHRHDIRRGKHSGEGAVGDGAAAAYPATAGASGNAAVAAARTRSVWSAVHASHVPSASGITPQPQLSQLRRHLPLLGQALRLVLTRSLGTAAAVAMLLIVLYILYTALNTWLAVYVFATLEVPGLLTGTAAVLLTVVQLLLLHVLTWFVVPVAAITGKGVWASLATVLRLLPAHLLPSLALFVFMRMLILALAITTETLLWTLAFVLTPSPLSASHAWVVAASFTHLFLSSILSTALSTLSLSLLAAVPALYVYLALGERLDARTGAVLGPQGQEEEEAEERGRVRVIEVRVR